MSCPWRPDFAWIAILMSEYSIIACSEEIKSATIEERKNETCKNFFLKMTILLMSPNRAAALWRTDVVIG